MNSDDVCDRYAEKGIRLTVRMLNEEDVLIEGTSDALNFLGELLLAVANEKEHSRHIGPNAAGNAVFSTEATKGLYIHRLPCLEEHAVKH